MHGLFVLVAMCALAATAAAQDRASLRDRFGGARSQRHLLRPGVELIVDFLETGRATRAVVSTGAGARHRQPADERVAPLADDEAWAHVRRFAEHRGEPLFVRDLIESGRMSGEVYSVGPAKVIFQRTNRALCAVTIMHPAEWSLGEPFLPELDPEASEAFVPHALPWDRDHVDRRFGPPDVESWRARPGLTLLAKYATDGRFESAVVSRETIWTGERVVEDPTTAPLSEEEAWDLIGRIIPGAHRRERIHDRVRLDDMSWEAFRVDGYPVVFHYDDDRFRFFVIFGRHIRYIGDTAGPLAAGTRTTH